METRAWTFALLALVGSSTVALADISGGLCSAAVHISEVDPIGGTT
jgi:hypothetical protein